MSKLLYIEASPRKARSVSIAVAQQFLKWYADANANDEIEMLDLWSTELPEFDGDTINAKYRILHGQDHTSDEVRAWDKVVAQFNHFNSAQKYVFSLPMWNFGVPYKLKHFIDVITQPGLAFSFSPESGYTGLVTGKPALLIMARGAEYTNEFASFDFQRPYLESLLKFIGFTDIRSVTVEPTLGEPDVLERAKSNAFQTLNELAKSF